MSTQPEALRLADALSGVLYSAKDTVDAAAELRRLHAENEALRNVANRGGHMAVAMSRIANLEAQRDALLEALKNILPFVATQAIGCHGYKCREQWCWSCYGEEDAEEAASQALVLANEASRIVEEVEETK